MGEPIRVLLVEPQGLVREGLTRLLRQEAGIAVAGAAADGTAALRTGRRLAEAGSVDLVVTELVLPDMDGLALVRDLKACCPALPILILAAVADGPPLLDILAGADGYLLKQDPAQELPRAIRVVAGGETYLSPLAARQLLRQARPGGTSRAVDRLSDREREVLGLLAAGGTSKGVALRLGLRPKTVENHRAHILAKLGVGNTASAVALATRAGLLDPAPGRAA